MKKIPQITAMIVIISIIIFVSLILSGTICGTLIRPYSHSRLVILTSFIVIAIALFRWFNSNSYSVVDTAHKGVLRILKKRTEYFYDEGVSYFIPFLCDIIQVEVREEVEHCIVDENIVTGDGVKMEVKTTIGYKVYDPSKSFEIEEENVRTQLENFVKSFQRGEASKYNGKNKDVDGQIMDWCLFMNANKELEKALKVAFKNELPKGKMTLERWGIEILSIKITGIVATDPEMMKTAQGPARERKERESEKLDSETLLQTANRLQYGSEYDEKNLVGVKDSGVRKAAEMRQRDRLNKAPSKSEVSINWTSDEGPFAHRKKGGKKPPSDPAKDVARGVVAGNQISDSIDEGKDSGRKD